MMMINHNDSDHVVTRIVMKIIILIKCFKFRVDTVDKSQYIFINKIYILIFLSMVSFQPLTTVVDLQKEREPGRRGTQTKYGRSEVLRIVSQELCK